MAWPAIGSGDPGTTSPLPYGRGPRCWGHAGARVKLSQAPAHPAHPAAPERQPGRDTGDPAGDREDEAPVSGF